MSDIYDEKAKVIAEWSGDMKTMTIVNIAQALRSAAADAYEDAAKMAGTVGLDYGGFPVPTVLNQKLTAKAKALRG